MSAEARLYQSQMTQRAPGTAYRVKDANAPKGWVDFDGFDGKVLQECKGPGYNQFLDPKRPGRFQPWFEATQREQLGGMVDQANRQLAAAKGVPVRWYVAEQEAAAAILKLLREARLHQIEVVYRPPLRQSKQ